MLNNQFQGDMEISIKIYSKDLFYTYIFMKTAIILLIGKNTFNWKNVSDFRLGTGRNFSP